MSATITWKQEKKNEVCSARFGFCYVYRWVLHGFEPFMCMQTFTAEFMSIFRWTIKLNRSSWFFLKITIAPKISIGSKTRIFFLWIFLLSIQKEGWIVNFLKRMLKSHRQNMQMTFYVVHFFFIKKSFKENS